MAIIENKPKKRKSPNGEGCVRQDKKTGRWIAAITIGYNGKGQQQFKYFHLKLRKKLSKS